MRKLGGGLVTLLVFASACGDNALSPTLELDETASESPVVARVGQRLRLSLFGIAEKQYRLEDVGISSTALSLVSATIPVLTPGGHTSVYTFHADRRGEATITVERAGPDEPAFVMEVAVE